MSDRGPHTKVNWTSTTAYLDFRRWRKEAERILNGSLSEKNDACKVNMIFMWGGAEVEDLIDGVKRLDPDLDLDKPKALLDQIGACLTHTTSFRDARKAFFHLEQQQGENAQSYYTRLDNLFRLSDFPDNPTWLIVERLIDGCANKESQRKLMDTGKDVTVQECLAILQREESLDLSMRQRHQGETSQQSAQVNAAYSRDPTRQSQKNGGKHKKQKSGKKHDGMGKRCKYCAGKPHKREQCPARDATCHSCKGKGHYRKACLKKRQHAVDISEESSTDDEGDLGISSIRIRSVGGTWKGKPPKEILATVKFHHKDSVRQVDGKVDSGAMVTTLPRSMMKDIGLSMSQLQKSTASLYGITEKLTLCGTAEVEVTCNQVTSRQKFYITEEGSELLLGLRFCLRHKLIKVSKACLQRAVKLEQEIDRVDAVHITEESGTDYKKLQKKWEKHLPLGKKTGDPLEDLKKIFPTTFDGEVGLFEGEVDLKLSPEAEPVQLPPRAVPLSVQPKLKAKLDEMEKKGIIRECPETTDWVHNLVLVVKKNGDLRVCLDPKNLNKFLVRNVHYTASWEDVLPTFRNGANFSTLDATSGYWTKKLSAESQLLTAFNTPFKKYCFVRMPFGLSTSSEIFCKEMDRALAGIPGTFPCADDVKVQGSNERRHDLHLLETVERAAAAGLKFNPEKCTIKKKKIDYFGRVITPTGVEPCPKKVRSILDLQAPVDKAELSSFLATVNILSSFIANLAQRTHLMRGLLKKNVTFVWTSDMEKEFNGVKKAIADATQLNHYDPNKEAVIETDASKKGLGAVLLQDGKPVRFLSKALTPTEAEYSNIERELLGVLFAVEKLHIYTFGRRVKVNTDHQPLESVFKKPVSLTSPRLQRMLIRLAKYDLEVKYVGANRVLVADTLSRLINQSNPGKPVKGLDVSVAQVLKVRRTRLEQLQEETKSDTELVELSQVIMTGWPESQNDLAENLHPYWPYRDELTVLDGIVMKGNRMLIPKCERSQTLQRLHEGHQGLQATLRRARRGIFWPNMARDIEESVLQCTQCQRFAPQKPKPAERQISTTRPNEVVGMDLMELNGSSYLVTVDYFSGYITVDPVSTTSTQEVIRVCNNLYQKFWPPERIVSDNGPCFNSTQFKQFTESLDIQHDTSSPHYHQSNGRAERAIRTVKGMMKKSTSPTGVTLALLAYHDTPVSDNLPSPAELFFSRRTNSRLAPAFQSVPLDEQQKAQLHSKRSSHLQPPGKKAEFVPNQAIWFTEDGSCEWKPGYIESKDVHPHSYWLVNEETRRRIRRNTTDLKPRYPVALERRQQPAPAPPQLAAALVPPPPWEPKPSAQPTRALPSTPPPQVLTGTPTPVPEAAEPPPSATPTTPKCSLKKKKARPPAAQKSSPDVTTTRSRSGRQLKPTRDPNFVYGK